MSVINPADCEVRAVIRFLNAKRVRPAEIHRQLVEVYGEGVMNDGNVRKWCRLFNEGRTNIHDDERSGRPTVKSEDLVQKVDDEIRQNRRFTIDELHEKFQQVSRSVIYAIVSEQLHYKKICARWVPKMLTDEHKTKRLAHALSFLERYDKEGDEFLSHIVTGDETWVSYYTPETKRQSSEWHHSKSPTRPRKFKREPSTRKIMATVFWDRKGILLIDFLPRGTTINAERYCETLAKLRRAIQNRRRGLLSSGVVLLHDNARPHVAARTQAQLDNFHWEILDHPPYSPDLAPSDFHLFPKLKEFLGGKRLESDEVLHETVTNWFKSQAAEFYEEGIQKLVPRLNKCLDNNGDYVEK